MNDAQSKKSQDEYYQHVLKAQREEHEKFANKVDGWYGHYYYKMFPNGDFRIVESIFSEDPPYYTD